MLNERVLAAIFTLFVIAGVIGVIDWITHGRLGLALAPAGVYIWLQLGRGNGWWID
jgi:hypothetical protein